MQTMHLTSIIPLWTFIIIMITFALVGYISQSSGIALGYICAQESLLVSEKTWGVGI